MNESGNYDTGRDTIDRAEGSSTLTARTHYGDYTMYTTVNLHRDIPTQLIFCDTVTGIDFGTEEVVTLLVDQIGRFDVEQMDEQGILDAVQQRLREQIENHPHIVAHMNLRRDSLDSVISLDGSITDGEGVTVAFDYAASDGDDTAFSFGEPAVRFEDIDNLAQDILPNTAWGNVRVRAATDRDIRTRCNIYHAVYGRAAITLRVPYEVAHDATVNWAQTLGRDVRQAVQSLRQPANGHLNIRAEARYRAVGGDNLGGGVATRTYRVLDEFHFSDFDTGEDIFSLEPPEPVLPGRYVVSDKDDSYSIELDAPSRVRKLRLQSTAK